MHLPKRRLAGGHATRQNYPRITLLSRKCFLRPPPASARTRHSCNRRLHQASCRSCEQNANNVVTKLCHRTELSTVALRDSSEYQRQRTKSSNSWALIVELRRVHVSCFSRPWSQTVIADPCAQTVSRPHTYSPPWRTQRRRTCRGLSGHLTAREARVCC